MKWTAASRRLEPLLVVGLPLAGAALALRRGWESGFLRGEVLMAVAGYLLCEGAVELGYHRHFAHRAFKAAPGLRVALLVLGAMSGKGSALTYAAIHRRHHRYADVPGDPHSPHLDGKDWRGRVRGAWHAYVGWLFSAPACAADAAWVVDMLRDPVVSRWGGDRAYYTMMLAGVLAPPLLGWLLWGEPQGALRGLLWGGAVRLFLQHQNGWLVNLLGHTVGTRPFPTPDRSRNNLPLALVSFGLGWHNNHHAFPAAASTRLRWWQLDVGGSLLALLERLGLVWDRVVPSAAEVAAARARPEPS